MSYRSDVRIITTKKGYYKLKKYVESNLNKDDYNLLQDNIFDNKKNSNIFYLGWNNISWAELCDFKHIDVIINGLKYLKENSCSYNFARMGENYDDYDSKYFISDKDPLDYLIVFDRKFDDDMVLNYIKEYNYDYKKGDISNELL
ncbi:MAG: hypothetical protein E7166_06850 [Firmicutes bacterium]|nr:hypothetical protein [Bacillota bacterium]